MNSFHLVLYQSGSDYKLRVLDGENGVEAEYDLMTASNSITLSVSGGNYVIGTGATIVDDDQPHKHQVGGSNSQTFTGSALEGIGLMDLRDMGRSGNLTVTYDLACDGIRLDGKSGTYMLWIKANDLDCVTVEE